MGRARPERMHRVETRDADCQSGHRADHGFGYTTGHRSGVCITTKRHGVEYPEHPRNGSDEAEQRRHGHQHLKNREANGHVLIDTRDHGLPNLPRTPRTFVRTGKPFFLGAGRLPWQHARKVPIALDRQAPHEDTAGENPAYPRPSIRQEMDKPTKQRNISHDGSSRCFRPACRRTALRSLERSPSRWTSRERSRTTAE